MLPSRSKCPRAGRSKPFNDNDTVILEGPTPTDTVGISIPVYRSITADQEKALEAHALQGAADHPDLLQISHGSPCPGCQMHRTIDSGCANHSSLFNNPTIADIAVDFHPLHPQRQRFYRLRSARDGVKHPAV